MVRRRSKTLQIVAAVNGKIPVMVDSGLRRGSDVLKALA
jgi:(S)-2-hydroxy-acid oxidase